MKTPKKLSDRVIEKLIARGLYDKTPDTNIERLNKSVVDHITDKIEDTNLSMGKTSLAKAIEKNKKKNKEKPIKTSLLLCTTRF